jgi:hypothetical protein
MIINLNPIASSYTTTVSLEGLVLTIDGIAHDLSVIPDGGQAEAETVFTDTITRDECTIEYHYESALAIPHQSHNRADYSFNVVSGDVPCPIVWKPIIEEEVTL